MTGEGDNGSISISSRGILVILTSQSITAVLQLLPAPGHPPAHVPVWDTLVRTGEVGLGAKIFTVYVGVVAAGVAEVMYTNHYTISPTLAVIRGHAALMLSISYEVYCCVAAVTTIVTPGALVTTSNIIVIISTSVSVLDHC